MSLQTVANIKAGMGLHVFLLPRDQGKNLGRIGGSVRGAEPSEEELGEEKCGNGLDDFEDGRFEGLMSRRQKLCSKFNRIG